MFRKLFSFFVACLLCTSLCLQAEAKITRKGSSEDKKESVQKGKNKKKSKGKNKNKNNSKDAKAKDKKKSAKKFSPQVPRGVKYPKPIGPTTPKGWFDDFEAAQAAAQATNRCILVLITGSDWCGWCKVLHEEVLDRKQFCNFASKALILYYADLPKKLPNFPKELKDKNEELRKQFKVSGYPTSVIIDAEGNELGKVSGAKDHYNKILEILRKAGRIR